MDRNVLIVIFNIQTTETLKELKTVQCHKTQSFYFQKFGEMSDLNSSNYAIFLHATVYLNIPSYRVFCPNQARKHFEPLVKYCLKTPGRLRNQSIK